MSYELDRARMEAARNAASAAYFKVRPHLYNDHNRRIFEAGFDRAWRLLNEKPATGGDTGEDHY